MNKYRKKPVVIEAVKWDGKDVTKHEILDLAKGGDRSVYWKANELVVETLEGDMMAPLGYYIIKGIKGELYPCAPDIFWATYEDLGDE